MSIDYEKLRTKAKAIVVIPEHYRLEMEDNTGDEKERSFIWEDPGKDDCQIEVTLDKILFLHFSFVLLFAGLPHSSSPVLS